MGNSFARLADLPLTIDSLSLEPRKQVQSRTFTRLTTEIRLEGKGEEGRGEDVCWDSDDQARFQRGGGELALGGSYTLASFSRRLAELELFASPPAHDVYANYRTWALESAALDLALRQNGTSLGALLGRKPQPVRFVSSMGLGREPTSDPVRRWLEVYPSLRFKLDTNDEWGDQLVGELAALGAIDVLDFKGHYTGDWIDNAPDPALYRRVAEGFADAILEDPFLNEETEEVLRPHRDRIAWDAPIHSVADIEALPFAPRVINIKPSRFGALERFFEAYDYCEGQGIRMYGGGQSEIGVGRGQIQHLASLFHPEAPNDIAPSGYNLEGLPSDLPESPLTPPGTEPGFR